MCGCVYFVMCGCFDNCVSVFVICVTCIYCVLYCLFCVLYRFVYVYFILICLVSSSIRTTAAGQKPGCSNNNNNNNNKGRLGLCSSPLRTFMTFSGVKFLPNSEIFAMSTEILDRIVVFTACASCSEFYRFKFGPNVFVLFSISKNGQK
jgi:hypothetical protein